MTRLTIISGGQVGVDQAALSWAISHGIPHGGWCPKGRLAADGVIPARYQLKETTTRFYAQRTERNVVDSDGTVIFTNDGRLQSGTRLTAELAIHHGKPLLEIHDLTLSPGARLAEFIRDHQIQRLNVAGSRVGVGNLVEMTLDEAAVELGLIPIPTPCQPCPP